MNLHESASSWRADRPMWEQRGVYLPGVMAYMPDEFRADPSLAMDALPTLTLDPNSAVPAMLTSYIDPEVFRVLFSPLKAVEIWGEVQKGDWLTETAFFPIVEATGETSSYGDYAESGQAGVNTNWPQRQMYRYQVIKQYGELELARAGLARINFVAETDKAAAITLNKFQNFTYFFGVQGLQNYGSLNDPNLSASLTPGTKAYSPTNKAWIVGGVILATANEIYSDFESLFYQLVSQAQGLISQEDELIVGIHPSTAVALTATNSFNVNVYDLLKKNFPKLRVVTATQYGQTSSTNPQGIAAGNLVQMIAPQVEGQRTGYCAYSEKMRGHPIICRLSSFQQKMSGGTFGTVLRQTFSIASMVGV
jgi:hypothetical protein